MPGINAPTTIQQIATTVMTPIAFPEHNVPSPFRIFATLLLIIAAVETVIMFLLPLLVPESAGETVQNITDALLLTVLSAPFIWILIAAPLRRSAVNEISRTQTVLGSIVDAVISFDEQGKIESLNPAAETIFGYNSAELVGKPITTVIPELKTDIAHPARYAQAKGRAKIYPIGTDTVGLRKDGNSIPMNISVTTLVLDQQTSCLAIIDDLSQRNQAKARSQG